jgi:hypothetical protein
MEMSSAPDTAGARTGPIWHPAASEMVGDLLISRVVGGATKIFIIEISVALQKSAADGAPKMRREPPNPSRPFVIGEVFRENR